MAKRGRRYDEGPKLNIKRVVAVIVFILFIIACIIGIKKLLDKRKFDSKIKRKTL